MAVRRMIVNGSLLVDYTNSNRKGFLRIPENRIGARQDMMARLRTEAVVAKKRRVRKAKNVTG